MRAGFFRVGTVLVAMMAAALVAVLVGYGSALAQVGCPCDEPGTPPETPTVISTSPTDGATNVDRDANIKAKFSEKMMKSSINRETFEFYRGHLTYQVLFPDPSTCGWQGECATPLYGPAKVGYSDKKKLAILNPKVRLAANTEYTAVVSRGVKDKDGTNMTDAKIWYFTTGDS